MQINLTDVNILCGDLGAMSSLPREPFSEKILAFLNQVSGKLLHDKEAKQYSDVVTFAFYCRKANLIKLKEKYISENSKCIGRGVTFHIAPSNVAINFAYTMAAGLLAGNICIVKASGKGFAQTRIVARVFQSVLDEPEFLELKPYVNVIEYSREKQEITEYFSSICNARVIWGGDATIEAVRKAPIPPRSYDVTFADRYSICVIKAESLLQCADIKKTAQDFYNDTYLYDQNACSSPRLVYWIGEEEAVYKAQELFWQAVWENIKNRYQLETVIAVDKYTTLCRTAIDFESSKVHTMPDNLIVRVQLDKLKITLPEYRAAGGCFHEYQDKNLETLASIVTEKYQTLSYYGVEKKELVDFVVRHGLRGIDRIVPIGKTADFGLTWDGYNLIRTLSREIYSE